MNADSLLGLVPLLLLLVIIGLVWASVRRNARNATVAPPIVGVLPMPEYTGPLSFFRRHFNGDYSLARSYWINTLLISLFAPLVGFMVLPLISENFPARYSSAFVLLVTAFGIVAWCWAVSGTWASANKHVQRGGQSGWATAAKVMIVLGFLKTFGDVGNLMPTLQEHLRVATGEQLGSSTTLELRADGRSVLLSGGINDGSAEQLDRALQLAPAVTTVVFNSAGGWIREGQMLANVVRKRGLNTYVEGYCASACTIAFLAGKERAAEPSAKIGFHASRSVGSMGSAPTSSETARLRAIYNDANLPDSFVRQALDTPHDKMWHPTHDVLLASGVFTRKSMGGETAALSTAIRSKEELVAEFKKTELFAALAERNPKEFGDLVTAAWGKMQQGATDAEVTKAAREQLTAALPRYLPLAKDETLIAYQALMQEQLEVLRDKDVLACVEMAFPLGKSLMITGNLPPDLTKRELALLTKIFREADAARGIKPTQQAVGRVAQRATAGMTQEQLLVFSDASIRRSSAPALICSAAITFFAGLNAIPTAERGNALRVLYAGN